MCEIRIQNQNQNKKYSRKAIKALKCAIPYLVLCFSAAILSGKRSDNSTIINYHHRTTSFTIFQIQYGNKTTSISLKSSVTTHVSNFQNRIRPFHN